MSIKSVAGLYQKMIYEKGLSVDLFKEISSETDDFVRLADLARTALNELSVNEKDFVRFMLIVQKAIVAKMVSDGEVSMLLADQDDSLKGYTHTIVMVVLGALIDEEVL